MKRRSGFVSNSSSASFIVGGGIITDEKKFRDWLNENFIPERTVEVKRFKVIEDWDVTSKNKDVLKMDALGSTIEINIKNAYDSLPTHEAAKSYLADSLNPLVFMFEGSGDEPWYDENTMEYNYNDVDISWFGDYYQKLFKAIHSKGIPGTVAADSTFGAGYDC